MVFSRKEFQAQQSEQQRFLRAQNQVAMAKQRTAEYPAQMKSTTASRDAVDNKDSNNSNSNNSNDSDAHNVSGTVSGNNSVFGKSQLYRQSEGKRI